MLQPFSIDEEALSIFRKGEEVDISDALLLLLQSQSRLGIVLPDVLPPCLIKRTRTDLFFHILGLWLDLRAESVDFLRQPLADAGDLVWVQLLEVLVAEVKARALALALLQ